MADDELNAEDGPTAGAELADEDELSAESSESDFETSTEDEAAVDSASETDAGDAAASEVLNAANRDRAGGFGAAAGPDTSAVDDPLDTGEDLPGISEEQLSAALVSTDESMVAPSSAAKTSEPTSLEPASAGVVPLVPAAPGVAPQTAPVALSENLPPSAPSVPPLSPAPLILYAGVRREVDQSLVDQTVDAGSAQAVIASTAPVTPGPVAAAAASPPVSVFTAIQQWFQRTFFAASPTFSPQTVTVGVEPGVGSPPFDLGAQDADTDTLTYTIDGKSIGTGTAAGTLQITGESASYTPAAGWDGTTAYADTFTVTASDDDGGFHIHGFSGLLYRLTFGLLGNPGHTATSTVTVNVPAVVTTPQPPTEPEPEPEPEPPAPEPEPSTPPAPPTTPQPPAPEPPATPTPASTAADRAFWAPERGVGFSVGSLGELEGQARLEAALNEVAGLGFTTIRTWGTDDYTGRILEAITRLNLPLKVQPGIYVTEDASARGQIDSALSIITPYADKVVGVSLGNEQLADWNTSATLTVPEVIGQVQYFKTVSSLPVTYDFSGATLLPGASGWGQNLAGLVGQLDYVSVHDYGGFFDNRNDPAWTPERQLASLRSFEATLADTLTALGLGSKPIVLGETGWQSTGYNPAVTNPANQQYYYELVSRYVYGPEARFDGMYYFNFTDESWKGGDDNWGLFGEGSATAIGPSKFTILPVSQVLAGESPTPPTAPEPEPQQPEVPGAAGTFPVSFANNTGAYDDDEIHVIVLGQATPGQWSWVDRDGVTHGLDHSAANAPGHLVKNGVNYADMSFTLAEAAGFRIPPELLGARIYVSLGEPLYVGIAPDNSGWVGPDPANPTDPNYDTVYDWYELSFKNGAVPFGGNTTQVDQFGFPFTFTLTQNSTGFSGTRGITLSREEVFQRFEDTMPAAFQELIIRDSDGDPLRILAPRSQQPGELATWFDTPVDSFWTKYADEQFVYNGPGFTVTGSVDAGNQFAYTVTSAAGASTSHTMAKPTTAEVWRADGPFVGTALQGAFLAHLDAAFHRGVATAPQDWDNAAAYYPDGGRWNNWAQFFHANSVAGFAYGFPYDDVNSQSSVLILNNSQPLTNLALTLGG